MKITRKLERKLRVLWEEAGIANDFIFGKIMQNPEFCRPMLERILHIKIARLEYTERQKDIKITGDGKGIRLDVYVKIKRIRSIMLRYRPIIPVSCPRGAAIIRH